MKIPKIFKPEDFLRESSQVMMAEDAQRAFEQWLKENGKVVYGFERYGSVDTFSAKSYDIQANTPINQGKTHQALLICIEPIKECEHDNYQWRMNHTDISSVSLWCNKCGAKLKSTKFEMIE